MMYSFNTIPEAIEDIKNGKIIIVVDDEDRENEGDFIVSGKSYWRDNEFYRYIWKRSYLHPISEK